MKTTAKESPTTPPAITLLDAHQWTHRRHPVTALEGTEAAAEHIAEQARLKGLAIQRDQIKAEKAKSAAAVAQAAAVYAVTKGSK